MSPRSSTGRRRRVKRHVSWLTNAATFFFCCQSVLFVRRFVLSARNGFQRSHQRCFVVPSTSYSVKAMLAALSDSWKGTGKLRRESGGVVIWPIRRSYKLFTSMQSATNLTKSR